MTWQLNKVSRFSPKQSLWLPSQYYNVPQVLILEMEWKWAKDIHLHAKRVCGNLCRRRFGSTGIQSSNSEISYLQFEAWKSVFVKRDMWIYMIDLWKEICKPVLKLEFTSHGGASLRIWTQSHLLEAGLSFFVSLYARGEQRTMLSAS